MGGGRARECPRAGTNESSHGQATDRPVGAASLELWDRPSARPRSRGPKCENEVSYGVWRSPVARVIWDHEVESSNLSTPTVGHGNARTGRCSRTDRPRGRRIVRRTWQFAHTSSHFLSSSNTASRDRLRTIELTSATFSKPGKRSPCITLTRDTS